MTGRGRPRRLALVLAVVAALAGCQSGTDPRGTAARLVVVAFGGGISGLTVTVSNRADDTVAVRLRNDPEDPNLPVADTSIRHDVLLEEVSVRYDAGGAPTPPPFSSGLSLRIPARSEVTATIVIVQAAAKPQAPLRDVRDPTTMTAIVRFAGRDGMGERVEAEGFLNVTFVR